MILTLSRKLPLLAILLLVLSGAHAQENRRGANVRRATIDSRGSGRIERCTIEVDVDGSAQVEITRDLGEIRTLSGRPAEWRRFHCTQVLPRSPGDFRLGAVRGRGSVRLLNDPRWNGGRALIHIDDPKGGRGYYLFDLQWRGGGGWTPAPPADPPEGGTAIRQAIRACQDGVTGRLNQYGYPSVTFGNTIPDGGPGRYIMVNGTATGRQRFGSAVFSFSCSFDVRLGRVQSVDVHRR